MENEPYCTTCECLKDRFYQRTDVEDPDFDYLRFSCSICLDQEPVEEDFPLRVEVHDDNDENYY